LQSHIGHLRSQGFKVTYFVGKHKGKRQSAYWNESYHAFIRLANLSLLPVPSSKNRRPFPILRFALATMI